MATNLPDYVASATPVPLEGRMPWFKSTAQTYAGILLWFVFWQDIPSSGLTSPAGTLAAGLAAAVFGVILAGLICHFASYLAPGLMGMKTGLSLAVVGTSTYGVIGGFLMPGFFMGILQFGWLAVNMYFSGLLLSGFLGQEVGSVAHMGIAIAWGLLAILVGIKGIAYVAKVATFMPLIPLIILLTLLGKTFSGVASFEPSQIAPVDAVSTVSSITVILAIIAYTVGFFATAGAAGVDIASSNRNSKDVQLGGLVGVAGATIFTGIMSLMIVAGAYGSGLITEQNVLNPTAMLSDIMGAGTGKVFMLLLAIAAFPPACFSSFIAAESMKNTLPKVNPFVSCGVGAAAAIGLVVSGKAGDAAGVFAFIGASFGPICGAMAADYVLSGFKWPGPRAGFNPAGWISWAVGFVVGAWPTLKGWFGAEFDIPCAPVAAIIVGFVLYALFAKMGMLSQTLEMPSADASSVEPTPAPAES